MAPETGPCPNHFPVMRCKNDPHGNRLDKTSPPVYFLSHFFSFLSFTFPPKGRIRGRMDQNCETTKEMESVRPIEACD